VARAINSEVKAGRGYPRAAVYLDVSTRMKPEEIIKAAAVMHHQFRSWPRRHHQGPMQVGPRAIRDGWVEVDGHRRLEGARPVAAVSAPAACTVEPPRRHSLSTSGLRAQAGMGAVDY